MTEHREDDSFCLRVIRFSLSAASRHLGNAHISPPVEESQACRVKEDKRGSLPYLQADVEMLGIIHQIYLSC